jgi:hypothetical protein
MQCLTSPCTAGPRHPGWRFHHCTDRDGDALTLFVFACMQPGSEDASAQLLIEVDHEYSDGGNFSSKVSLYTECMK